ncbi:MAG TPA: glycerol-3-phosphate 1-O-acyltransferase PlsY [Blastocatellia bacterium]|jgi:glycerol-3-phosphate acyltransferase PlsY|nr:glycerol-3-phosphate 1-O-acyltransferase PlsY [Blastocatellia bacterium]
MLLKTLLVILAYMLGSIPFGYLLVKYVFTGGEDVRKVGSGSTGATNVMRRAGIKAGLLTYVFDVLKGLAAVLVTKSLIGDDYAWIGAAAVAAIAGHIFPVFLNFRGGKGVATGVGVYLALAPYSVLSTLVLWGAIVYFTRYVSLGSIIGTAAVPFWTLLYYGWLQPSPHLNALLVVAVAGCALIVARHGENIKRLSQGTESKIGQKADPPPGSASPDPTAFGGGRS